MLFRFRCTLSVLAIKCRRGHPCRRTPCPGRETRTRNGTPPGSDGIPRQPRAGPSAAAGKQCKTPKALEAADGAIKERLFLISKDGVNGPDIDQLRQETTANVNGAGEEHFKDTAFVDAAKNLHEAKLLAEGVSQVTSGRRTHKRQRQTGENGR